MTLSCRLVEYLVPNEPDYCSLRTQPRSVDLVCYFTSASTRALWPLDALPRCSLTCHQVRSLITLYASFFLVALGHSPGRACLNVFYSQGGASAGRLGTKAAMSRSGTCEHASGFSSRTQARHESRSGRRTAIMSSANDSSKYLPSLASAGASPQSPSPASQENILSEIGQLYLLILVASVQIEDAEVASLGQRRIRMRCLMLANVKISLTLHVGSQSSQRGPSTLYLILDSMASVTCAWTSSRRFCT